MHIPVYYHKYYLRSTAIIAVVANVLLLLLLNQRSSRVLGNYRFLIGSFALADIIISLFHAWYVPIFILGEFGFVWFGHGILFKKSSFALDSNIVYAATFYLPFCLLGMHFIYRYLSLTRPKLVNEQFKLFFSACTVYTILYVLISSLLSHFGQGAQKSNFGIRLMAGEVEACLSAFDDNYILDWPVLAALIAAILLIGHTLLISLICIVKISMIFNSLIDIRTRRLQIHLFRALLIQFAIPVLFSLIPLSAIFLLPMTGMNLGEIGNIFGLLASVYPALDPILIIVSVSSFRQTIQRCIYVIFGSTASRNEREALERSRKHSAMIYTISMNMM